MTYPLTATGPGRSLLEAAPGNPERGSIPHVLERRCSLKRSPRDFAKGAKPAFDAQVLAALVFSVKTFVAAMLALYISFWLGLDEPYWALLTSLYRRPSLIAASSSLKDIYRLLGTAAGILVTIALVFALPSTASSSSHQSPLGSGCAASRRGEHAISPHTAFSWLATQQQSSAFLQH